MLLLVKLQAKAFNFTKSNTPLSVGVFHVFKTTNGTELHKASHIIRILGYNDLINKLRVDGSSSVFPGVCLISHKRG